ncbi:hypothetical protein KIN20_017440 [Parelaphostrongylus tenuis]|uniref:Uncharacterized protein n=1 Tax=Parelaphostrongylus tenuis TaxID=148309 RepID=A0AAD5QRG1_PARTN|nr:hypothetical protein KIN20_017440 [Parelaphostrongylus tenuis]
MRRGRGGRSGTVDILLFNRKFFLRFERNFGQNDGLSQQEITNWNTENPKDTEQSDLKCRTAFEFALWTLKYRLRRSRVCSQKSWRSAQLVLRTSVSIATVQHVPPDRLKSEFDPQLTRMFLHTTLHYEVYCNLEDCYRGHTCQKII